ncbi:MULTISPECIES: AraC family transcriptional regulator [unclassified Rhizobium]|uniref:helix-turn-helix domain-containing protein n=1 Tax=unclassified Rhizobium TaxID=2613769 RepID=UPI0017E1ACF5|nr:MULTISPECIES: AraC family transcriptional regulator [unclassified Rhizobium]MBB3543041.1 AraC-like DNA-binding protein [Rhizobium sp. BK399]MCS3742258.1 AraC-like DNA-binding protein [Rhizobium sp. BK661]
MAVTELRYDNPSFELSNPPKEEDAFMVGHYLVNCPKYLYWEGGIAAKSSAIGQGETIIYDLKRKPTFLLNHAFHTVHYYFSREALNAISEEAGAPRIDELRYSPAVASDDPVMRYMSAGLLPFFERPNEASVLFMDHVMLAIGIHVATRYGGMLPKSETTRGGLAPWQEKRAKEMIGASLGDQLPLALVAGECGVSTRHFSRAFRQSVGLSPHQWLTQCRVGHAKRLLAVEEFNLAQVAFACGFADQSHFTRVFTAITGNSPGAWRRANAR